MARRPNILFVFSDQQRAVSTGCYGNREVRTPAMDSLAAQGARAVNAISNAPLCCPYRASLMTGMYSYKVGMPTNFQTFRPTGPCLGEAFKAGGYTTGYVGKFHLHFPTGDMKKDYAPEVNHEYVPPGRRCGFEDFWGGLGEGHNFHDWNYYRHNDPTPIPCKRYQAEVQTDMALEFIRENARKSEPWIQVLSYSPPHPPFETPPQYLPHYVNPEVPANVPSGICREYAQKNLPRYYGLIESVDDQLARLLEELDKQGITEETIVVFTSDHGELLAAHGYMGHKRWPYSDSIRVPFMMRWPGKIKAGRTLEKPLGAIDLYPTLLDLAGLPVPQGLDGKSAANALLTGDETARDEYAYCHMHYAYVPWPGWRALRSSRYLYARTVEAPWLLFDVQADPLEQHNLIHDSGHRALKESLDVMLSQRMHEAGDSWDLNLETGDAFEYHDASSEKLKTNDLGVPWPGGPYPFEY